MTIRYLLEYSEDDARRVAEIVGPYSGAARALAELEERRRNGEDVSLYRGKHDDALYVGPTLKAED